MEKQCRGKCREWKPLDDFYKHPKGKYGRASWCKQCQKDHIRAKRESQLTPEQVEIRSRRAQERTLELIGSTQLYDRRAKLKKKYGITILEYHELLSEQGGRCAICGRLAEEERYGRLHVDHCHLENRVRGLLCTNCNNGVGRFMDSPELMRLAADYLEKKGVLNGQNLDPAVCA